MMDDTRRDLLQRMIDYYESPGAELGFDPELCACQYRTIAGGRCAVGALIPDEDYDPMSEGVSVLALIGIIEGASDTADALRNSLASLDIDLRSRSVCDWLYGVQDLHDSYVHTRGANAKGFAVQLREVMDV